jgi:O-acetyl-ADP-ribose deacetylase (regulator of RNase III)
MGAGLAKQIRNKYPFAYECYVDLCNKVKEKEDLLGRIKQVKVSDGKIIAHIFSQLSYGRGRLQTDYVSLKHALKKLEIKARNFEESVALPWGIGCGLAGGDWNIVHSIIEDVFKDYEVTLYKFK